MTKEKKKILMRDWIANNPDYKTRSGSYYKEWAKLNRERLTEYHLLKSYNLTIAQRDELFFTQGRRCGICRTRISGSIRGWQIDADHSVKPARVRGILCKGCNTALGVFRHDIELFKKAIEWLKK